MILLGCRNKLRYHTHDNYTAMPKHHVISIFSCIRGVIN